MYTHEIPAIAIRPWRRESSLDDDKPEPAPREDGAIGPIMQVVALVQPFRVQVEAVAVLHKELPHPQQPRLRPRFIAKLRLDLVPDLRQLLVAPQLKLRAIVVMISSCVMPKTQIGTLAIFQAKTCCRPWPTSDRSLPRVL